MKKRFISVLMVLVLMLTIIGCSKEADQNNKEVILATTTSTYDSGLLDVLIPMFEEQTDYVVSPIAVGTGAALEMGKRGDADVLLVHAPAAEMELLESEDAINRKLVMHNDFVIVGPKSDPAAIQELNSVTEALESIAEAGERFVSRGDDSGTNKKEIALWKEAGIQAEGDWYIASGKGMGDTLNISSEEQAYTLTDRGTYLALKKNLDLEILFEGDESLKNIYHVMQVNPEKHDNINANGAAAFVDFLLQKDVQVIITDFGKEKFGQPLFFPDALSDS